QNSSVLIVVQATVPVGPCHQHGWVHSPVRGRHPELREGVETFVKHFGGKRAGEAARIFRDAGVATMTHAQAADTEAGKIWELAQYGLQSASKKSFMPGAPHVAWTSRPHTREWLKRIMTATVNLGLGTLCDPFLSMCLARLAGI